MSGRPVNQAMSTKRGVQKSVNWMLRSIARSSASIFGGLGSWKSAERMKYITATVPASKTENENSYFNTATLDTYHQH